MNHNKIKKEHLVLALIFFLALGLRLGYLFFLKNHYFFYDHPSADVVYYQDWARQIASGHWLGSPDFQGLPLYPYFLGFLMRLTLGNLFAIRIFHVLLGSLNCILIYQVAKNIFNSRIAFLSAFLAATNFYFIYYDWLMMPVTLIIFLSLIMILALLSLTRVTRIRDWFILGLLIGLGILGDGKFLIFLFVATVYLMAHLDLPYEKKLKTIIVPLTLGAFLVLCSITVRNKIVFGRWILISPQSGLSFYVGNNPQASGIFENPRFIRPTHSGQDADQGIVAQMASKKELDAQDVSSFWRQKGLDFIRQQPLQYLILLGKKFLLFFKDTERAHDLDLILQANWRERLNYNPYYILCPLALLGIFAALKEDKHKNIFPLLLILSQLGITLIFFLNTRHRITILPLLLIYESFFISKFLVMFNKRAYQGIIFSVLFVSGFVLFLPPEYVNAKSVAFIEHAKKCAIFEVADELDKAKKECLTALEISPGDSVSLYNLGNVFFKQDNLSAAQAAYLRSLAICSYNIDARFNLGFTYEKLGQYQKALESYQEVLKYQPRMPDVHYRMASIYQKTGDCDKTKRHIDLILGIDPTLTNKIHQFIPACPSP